MDKTTSMNNSIQSINSLLLQPQVTKLQQEQPCDFVVPQIQALWTTTRPVLPGMATSHVLVASSFVAINPKRGSFCRSTILPLYSKV